MDDSAFARELMASSNVTVGTAAFACNGHARASNHMTVVVTRSRAQPSLSLRQH